jgi:hypothetical protein
MDQIKGIQMKNGLEIDQFGNKSYYLNGRIHRIDGPAIEYNNGAKFWYFNGELHRLDGPAIEWENGDKEWYYHNEQIDCQSQQKFEQWLRFRAFL